VLAEYERESRRTLARDAWKREEPVAAGSVASPADPGGDDGAG
jgi:hypothetical protein